MYKKQQIHYVISRQFWSEILRIIKKRQTIENIIIVDVGRGHTVISLRGKNYLGSHDRQSKLSQDLLLELTPPSLMIVNCYKLLNKYFLDNMGMTIFSHPLEKSCLKNKSKA